MSEEELDTDDCDEEYSRETMWGTYDGNELPIKELEDSHILNLLTYLGKRVTLAENGLKDIDKLKDITLYKIRLRRLKVNQSLLKVINDEIELRCLDRKLVEGGKPLPFKKNGQWMIWKEGDARPTPIPNSIDFIKPLDGKED